MESENPALTTLRRIPATAPSTPQTSISRPIALLAATLLVSVTPLASAALAPANIFADHMVLQADLPLPIWGGADPNASVTIEFNNHTATTKADVHGRWKLTFPAQEPSSTGRSMMFRSGDHEFVLRDILIGEVWIASGQSNMGYEAGKVAGLHPETKAVVDSADFPAIRFRRVREHSAPAPQPDLGTRAPWDICTPQSVFRHSAVAFLFARRLHQDLNIPVGIIDCSQGGTPIEPHIPAFAFTGHPTLEKLAALAKSSDIEAIKALPGGTFVRSPAWLAGALYNSRIAPVAPYAIRGTIWYQGESNSGGGEDPRCYAHKMRALVTGWRAAWGRDNLPFYYVQLPQRNTYARTWLREEQRRALDVPHTGMVVTIDLVDQANFIHPPNKIDVAHRLARWALAKQYGKPIPTSGPTYRSHAIHGNAITLVFEHAANGLISAVPTAPDRITPTPDTPLHGFEITAQDGQWFPARALIKDNTITLSSPDVPLPVAARYACYPQAPEGQTPNLYNKSLLPASPFCTDWSLMPYDPARNRIPR